MRTAALALLVVLTSSTGCYFGRSASSKQAAYVANGAAVAVGGLLLLSPSDISSGCYGAQDMCWTGSNPFQELAGVVALIAGVTGIIINVSSPTQPEAKPVASAPRAATASVTTPGLRPTAVEVR